MVTRRKAGEVIDEQRAGPQGLHGCCPRCLADRWTAWQDEVLATSLRRQFLQKE
jgi:hypothetical protein